MNILYLSADRGIPIRGDKGAAVHIRSICAAFARLGHTVTLLTPAPGPEGGQEVQARLVPVPLPEVDASGAGAEADRERQALLYRELLLQAALRELKAGEISLIYERHSLWSDVGAWASAVTGIPFVLEVNAPLREEAARYRSLFNTEEARRIEMRQFRGAAAVAAVSEAVARAVIDGGAQPERVRVLPNGVDPELFHPAVRGGKIHGRYNLHGKHIIGFVGRARPWHDLGTLLQAFAELHRRDERYHLLLVGQMPDGIQADIEELGLAGAVTRTGPVPHSEVPEHLAACTVAVSSHAALENFYFSPLKLFEYLACGVPTVAADLGQPSAIIRPGENGELYTPGNPYSLAERIERLVRNPAYAGDLAWAGAAEVLTRHTWEQNARQVLAWMGAPTPEQELQDEKIPPLPVLDDRLKQRLYRATRPDLAANLLRGRVPLEKRRTPLAKIEVLKYKPGRRCVLRYTWAAAPERRPLQVIGKVFRDDRGRRLDEVQQLLWHNGLGAGRIRVPQSFGYVREMRMQLQEAADGETLNDLYRAQGDVSRWIPLAAQGLARLHVLNRALPSHTAARLTRWIGTYHLADEIANLETIRTALTEMLPESAQRFEGLHAHLAGWGASLAQAEDPVLIHRDFYYSQLLIDAEDRLTIIDLDLLAHGDAAIDVANFTAHLYFLGLETNGDFFALAAEADRFKAAYQAERQQQPDFWERAAFYEAATLFRLLRVVAARPLKQPVWEPLLEQVLCILEPA